MPNVESNLWKIRWYKFLGECWFIMPAIVPFYKANGLSASQVFTLQAIFSFCMLLCEVPSGYLSDAIGRRKTLILGGLVLPLGIAVYALSHSLWWFALAECMLAFAWSMRSGTDSAVLYDSLLQLGRQEEYKRFEGKSASFERLGTALSSVLGGWLAAVSLRLPFYVNILPALTLTLLSFTLVEPERKLRHADNPLRDVLGITKYALSHRRILGIMLYSSLLLSTGIIGIWASFFYFDRLRVPLAWYGIYFALFQLLCAAGARFSHTVERAAGRRNVAYLFCLIPAVFILLGLVRSPLLICLTFVNALLWGISTPLLLDALNARTASETRATVLSVSSMLGRAGFVVLAPVLGWVVDRFSLSAGFHVLAGYFVVVSIAAAVLMSGGEKEPAGEGQGAEGTEPA